jgi:EAL domain-containing protein (putative c-di-GMP-specific phosphodiesterase class I)
MSDFVQRDAPEAAGESVAQRERTPLCFVVEEQSSIRQFLSLMLHGSGVDTEEFADGTTFRQAIVDRKPDLVFIDIALDASDGIESVVSLGKQGYFGFVQLMSNRGSAVLEHVKAIGLQHKMNMLPVLKKPFDTGSVARILHSLRFGHAPAVATRIGLKDALNSNWIDFWYQPKIDLRRKKLAGAETFVRVKHPEHGYVEPAAFMPGAGEADLIALGERALVSAVKAEQTFAKIGVSLRLAINIPLGALATLPVADIIRAQRPAESWAGLTIDVTEEQVVKDPALAEEMAKALAPLNIRLAVDHFGRAYSSLVRRKELPFAELKLDRSFVTDCSTSKVNAPLCRTVIGLAHKFGCSAVAIGIEKAADAVALVSMGCDYGQGFLFGQPMPEERFLSLLRQRANGAATSPGGKTAAQN